MDYKIVADSCCDLTPDLKKQLGVTTVPLSLTLGNKTFVDDETLNLTEYMEEMKSFTGKIGSACPSPGMYKEAFTGALAAFAITLSSKLSGSHASAVMGKALAEEEGAQVHVFDSKSASAGELLIAVKLHKLIHDGLQHSAIVSTIEAFIDEMKTYFVLDNLDNLIKNGRIGKLAGKLISGLGIKPIMGSDGDGSIVFVSPARGENQIIEKLADTIEKSGRQTAGECMVITHCNNPGLAGKLMNAIQHRYHFSEILVVPTGGLSSMYANNKGLVMAF